MAYFPSVTVSSITAGENHLGAIGGNTTIITATPTLSVAGAYSAGDFVGTTSTAITLTNSARVNAGSGIIQSAVLVDGDVQSVSMELWVFDTTFTPPTDNAAWSISDAVAATLVGVVPFTTYYTSALNSVSQADNLGIGFVCGASSRNLFAALVTRGTPTFTSGNLSIRLVINQD